MNRNLAPGIEHPRSEPGLEDTLKGKMKAWSDPERRQSKRLKDLADIARLIEAHPRLWDMLTADLKEQVQPPGGM